jgi:NTE family protein
MASVGLVLGGGGITGAAYHLGALLTLEMATGWRPDDAEVIVGTSCGAFTAAMVRGGQLSLDTFLDDAGSPDEMSDRLRSRIYRRGSNPAGVVRWIRRGILPGLTRPDLRMIAGSPAMYRTDGIVEWVEERLGPLADSWPERPTVIVGYDVQQRVRVPFGTDAAPEVALKYAVAASAAVPMVFEPVRIDGRLYLDGGISSGTSADLVLGSQRRLDLVIVIAPMAASERRPGARFYEGALDRAGNAALGIEIDRIAAVWPDTDVVVFRPDERVLAVTRPNPLSTRAAVPAFLRTLRSFKEELGHPDTWEILSRHLVGSTV